MDTSKRACDAFAAAAKAAADVDGNYIFNGFLGEIN